jgi:hypothetical protein
VGFTGGVFVAAGDVDGDSITDIITGPGVGGAAHVKVFNGRTGDTAFDFIASFGGGQVSQFSLDVRYSGGARVAAIDLTADGRDDIIVLPGPGIGPTALVYDGAGAGLIRSFTALDLSILSGIFVG